MRRVLVVAVREYQAAVRTKAFLITMLAMPLLMGGSIAFQVLLRNKVDTTEKRVAILDETGELFGAIAAAAAERNETDIFENGNADSKQTKPRFLVEAVETTEEDLDRVKLDLSERVRSEKILGFVFIPANVIHPHETDSDEAAAAAAVVVEYHSNKPTYDDFQKWVAGPINHHIQQLRLAQANLDPDVVTRAMLRTRVTHLGLLSTDEQGVIIKAEESNERATIAVALGLMMLMFMVVMIGAQPLMMTVLEEKMQRIAEMLLGSIPPFQLMMGKLLGTVGVSLTMAVVYLAGAFFAVHRSGYGALFPSHLVWWFVVFQALAILMFGSLFIAIGAAVSDQREAQSLVMPVTIPMIAPMFVWINVVREPDSTMSVVLSLIPPFTPMLMLIRQAVPPGVPLWQPALGIVLMLLTTAGCVFAAGRVFRVGILMQGQGAKIGQMMRWVVKG